MTHPPAFSEIQPQLLQFLRKHQLMAISTYYQEPWIANVYYAVDDKLHFYFVSNEDKIHSQHILHQSQVACSVYDSTQTPKFRQFFSKTGVQFSGTAYKLTQPSEIEEGLSVWRKALQISSSDYFTVENIMNDNITQKVWKVIPNKLKFFNEELFDEEKVPLFALDEV